MCVTIHVHVHMYVVHVYAPHTSFHLKCIYDIVDRPQGNTHFSADCQCLGEGVKDSKFSRFGLFSFLYILVFMFVMWMWYKGYTGYTDPFASHALKIDSNTHSKWIFHECWSAHRSQTQFSIFISFTFRKIRVGVLVLF